MSGDQVEAEPDEQVRGADAVTALSIFRTLDRIALDLLSECPRCHDLWPLHRVRCDCGEQLLPNGVKAQLPHPSLVRA